MTDYLLELYGRERIRLALEFQKGLSDGEYMRPVFGEGKQGAKIMLIGEAPGAEETKAGKPFVGKAGRHLNELLDSISLDRKDLFVTNVVKYRPVLHKADSISNRTPKTTEIMQSLNLLEKEITAVSPFVIVTLGNVPLKAVQNIFGISGGTIGEVHGTTVKVMDGLFLFPLYHPASSIYNRELKAVHLEDIVKLRQFLNINGII